MHTFSIRDIENLSGIKAHTLRVWEQRYGLIMPGRKESLHREYSNEDLKQILRVSYLYHHGYKISKIAAMSPAEINSLSLDYNQHSSFEVFINQLIEASIDFDEEGFEKVLHSLILHLGFEKSFIHVVYPYLNKVGILWMTGNVLPAQEHFSSNLIRKKIILEIDGLPDAEPGGLNKVLLFAPTGEFHEIPLLLIHYLLKKNGFPVIYFGTNTSLDMLKLYTGHHDFFALYFHLVTNFINLETGAYIDCLVKNFPGKKIFASGPVFNDDKAYPENVRILFSLNEIYSMTLNPV